MDGVAFESEITTDWPEVQRDSEVTPQKRKLIEPVKAVILRRERGQKLATTTFTVSNSKAAGKDKTQSDPGFLYKIDRFMITKLTWLLDAAYDFFASLWNGDKIEPCLKKQLNLSQQKSQAKS